MLKKTLFATPTGPSQWDSCSPNQCLCSNCSTGSSGKSIAFITVLFRSSQWWIPLLFRARREIFLSQFLLQIDPQLQAHTEALIKQRQNCFKKKKKREKRTLGSFFRLFIIHDRLSKHRRLRKKKTHTHFGPNRISNVRIYILAERAFCMISSPSERFLPLFWSGFDL